jgi:predicted PurR-regulated permease PerM
MVAQEGAPRKAWITILIILGIAVFLWLCWISLPVLIPFLVGILLAYLLWPLVNWLEKILQPKGKEPKSKRAIAVVIVFAVFAIVLIVFIASIGAAMIAASSALVDKVPDLVVRSTAKVSEWLNAIRGMLPADTVAKFEKDLTDAAPAIGKFAKDFVVGSLAVIPSSMPTILGFITLPFFLIFVLINYQKYSQYLSDIFPGSKARHAHRMLKIFGDQMGRYIRYQIILAAIAGLLVFLGTAILGMEYAAALGAVTAFTQVIPIIGPFISAAIILIVTLALKPEVILWVIGIIIVTQVIVNLVQGPLQQRHFPLDPAVIMVLLTVGGFIGSYWGMILALPVGATVWDIYKYFRDMSRSEQIKTEVT